MRVSQLVLTLLLLLVMLGFASATTVDVNVLRVDGITVNGTKVGYRSIYNYNLDGNLRIDFNVVATDLNVDDMAGTAKALTADIFYSTDANKFQTAIVLDLNLWALKDPTNINAGGLYCDDMNFNSRAGVSLANGSDMDDANHGVTCHWDFNILNSRVSDGNYFIDINIHTSTAADSNGSDSTDFNIGIDNVPTVFITKIDGKSVYGAATNWRTIYNNHLDGNLRVDFNVVAIDLNSESFPRGNKGWLNASLFYSSNAKGFTNSIFSDVNLFEAAAHGTGQAVYCDDLNFNSRTMSDPEDANTGVTCHWDFNIHLSKVEDGNYFIDVNIRRVGGILDLNASDSSDFNIGIDNVPNVTVVKLDGGVDTNAGLFFSQVRDGNVKIDFNVTALDINIQLLTGEIGSWAGSTRVYAKLGYSGTAGAFSNIIYKDLNILATDTDLWTGTSLYCDDLNFNSGMMSDPNDVNKGTTCHWDLAIGNIVDGNYFIDINVVIGASIDTNRGTVDSSDYIHAFDNQGPVLAITAPAAGALIASPNVSINYSTSDANIGVKQNFVKLDNGPWVNNSIATTYVFASLGSGAHTLYVRSQDSADNNSEANVSITAEAGGAGGAVVCGDAVCGAGENSLSCPNDCAAVCGDGACTGTENPESCPEDCLSYCGDSFCVSPEDCSTCFEDCGTCGEAPGITIPGATILNEQTQVSQPTVADIDSVFADAGFTESDTETAKSVAENFSVSRNIKVLERGTEGAKTYESRITIGITNKTSETLKNVRVVEYVPKAVASSASQISSSKPFAVLKDDPIIQFTFAEVAPGKTATAVYSVAKKLEPSEVASYMVAPIPAYAVTEDEAACGLVDCDDRNPCTTDLCFTDECAYVLVKDGTSCGFGKECSLGTCRNISAAAPIAGVSGVGIETVLLVAVVIIVAFAIFKFYSKKGRK